MYGAEDSGYSAGGVTTIGGGGGGGGTGCGLGLLGIDGGELGGVGTGDGEEEIGGVLS